MSSSLITTASISDPVTRPTPPRRRPHAARFGSNIVGGYVVPAHTFAASVTQRATRPGLVTAGFILAWVIPILGLILSAAGLPEAKRRDAGVLMAYVGIVASSGWILLALAFALGIISRPYYW